jgi:hypothetical protein
VRLRGRQVHQQGDGREGDVGGGARSGGVGGALGGLDKQSWFFVLGFFWVFCFFREQKKKSSLSLVLSL